MKDVPNVSVYDCEYGVPNGSIVHDYTYSVINERIVHDYVHGVPNVSEAVIGMMFIVSAHNHICGGVHNLSIET